MPAPDLTSPFAAEEIFRAATALPTPDRATWLATACEGQPGVRAHVERMLLARAIGTFLRESGSDFERAETTAEGEDAGREEAGARFGNYQLIEPLGEGGFGVVWLAEQLKPVQRRVALKILKLGMDTREVIARFEQERQALAFMDHPGIAKVFDAGATPTGRPFFVMEVVRGIPITEYCDQARLATADRLQLFIAVCQAVQHAHQKGVIHRDLKPSNILVARSDGWQAGCPPAAQAGSLCSEEHDGAPAPKIIDFGVAKATDAGEFTARTAYTQFGQMLGTLHYMSPEQAATGGFDLDTRSDIYALGVLLYELLTGRTPFDPDETVRRGWEEVWHAIREQEPPRPSTAVQTMTADARTKVAEQRQADGPKLIGQIRGDLDWIVMKALEKDRTRRYETANGLALDLQRHLQSEPVLARPPSFGYKAGKFIRRYRGRVIAAAALLVTLLAGLAASTVLYLREKAAWTSEAAHREKAEASERIANDEATKATRETARATQEAARSAQTAKFLQEMLAGVDAKRARQREPILFKEILDLAAQRVGGTFKDQPEVELQLRGTIAQSYRSLHLRDAAMPHFERVIELATKLHGLEHPTTIEAVSQVAKIHFDAREYTKAVELREQVAALRRKVLGANHPDTLKAMTGLAAYYDHAGRPDDGLKLREEILALTRKVQGPDHFHTFTAMSALATSYSAAGRRDEALTLLEQVREGTARAFGPENRQTLGAMNTLARAYGARGRLAEAIELQEPALAIERRVLKPGDPQFRAALENLAEIYEQSGRQEEALKLREEVADFRSKYK